MAAYHLWHPAYVTSEPVTLECFVTLGESLLLANGTDTFATAALMAMGINVPLRSWTMQPMRTHYFGSYTESLDHWEDRWSLAWRLRLLPEIERAPALPLPPPWGFFDLDEADASFHPMHRPQLAPGWRCLLIADATEHSTLVTARQSVLTMFPSADCVWGKAFGAHSQLRCDLGYFEASYYQRGAPAVEEVLVKLQAEGAYVRFHNLQTRRTGKEVDRRGR